MKLEIYQVDAFASRVFQGNPAAVCPLEHWLPDEMLLNIAEANNLSETAFFVLGDEHYQLRWFTPEAEVDLCGHATLASAHILFQHLDYKESTVRFMTKSGELVVKKKDSGYQMDFPVAKPEAIKAPALLVEALSINPVTVLAAYDYIVVLENQHQIEQLKPDFTALCKLDLRGVLVTAPGDEVDFVSRCFFPKLRVNEDPVTGSAHCELAPYWQQQLNKERLVAKQLSKRTGMIECVLSGERVLLSGTAVDYLKGEISI